MSEFTVKHKGGKWWHVDGGLNLTKKRLGEFMYAALSDPEIHLGNFWAFNPAYSRSSVFVTLLCTDEAKIRLQTVCPWLKIIPPPEIHLN